jgi:hypothetical protein
MSGNPPAFSPRAAAALVVAGVLMFAALLWQVGGGLATGQVNNGGGHGAGKGLNGFAGLAQILRDSGREVALARGKGALATPGVLVLTPPSMTDGGELDKVVSDHRRIGSVVVIVPKWEAGPMASGDPSARQGWVRLWGTELPRWDDFLKDVAVELRGEGQGARRAATVLAAPAPILPEGRVVEVGSSPRLVPLADAAGHVLAARYDETVALPGDARGDPRQRYPLYVVFEPDLLDNYGLSHADNALWAEAFFHKVGAGQRVTFDLTLNGLGTQPNLLTLAFMPPYLTATLVLGLAVVAAMWRGLMRFGPAADEGRAVPLGKASLLGNAAGLVVRARRFHVLGGPYVEAVRGRLARALSLPRSRDAAAVDAAIDRALGARGAYDPQNSFTATAARLARATHAREVVALALRLHAIERILIP